MHSHARRFFLQTWPLTPAWGAFGGYILGSLWAMLVSIVKNLVGLGITAQRDEQVECIGLIHKAELWRDALAILVAAPNMCIECNERLVGHLLRVAEYDTIRKALRCNKVVWTLMDEVPEDQSVEVVALGLDYVVLLVEKRDGKNIRARTPE